MGKFYLPDLGEGLQGAEIVEWKIRKGDEVKIDQLILVVETAKAIVEIPSPVDATVDCIYFSEGDNVEVGEPLMEYKESSGESKVTDKSVSVVGHLQKAELGRSVSDEVLLADESNKSEPHYLENRRVDMSPATRLFAKKLGVEDVVKGSDYIEVSESALLERYQKSTENPANEIENKSILALKGARKVMAQTMSRSHEKIPAVTLFDDADISSWSPEEDITLRCIRAIIEACKQVPILNAWFDEESLSIQLFDEVNLGVAVNLNEGLFVPVLRDAQGLSEKRIREILDKQIRAIQNRSIKPQKLLGATISLSNFGSLSGRYATPIIVPPQVAIIGVGKLRQEAVVNHGKIEIGRIMPISLSFDHRAASGAEAAKFMQIFIKSLCA